jgi:hypothetical protein
VLSLFPPAAAETNTCTIQADADILGLGVRLGLYFQFVANFVVSVARPSEAVDSLSVSNILFSGIFIAILYAAVNNNVPAGELLTMLSLLPFDILASLPIFIAAASKDSKVKPSIPTTAFVVLRTFGIIIFGLWFWYHGLDFPNPEQCMEPRVFLYANLAAHGGARIAYKVFVTFMAVFFTVSLLSLSLFACIFSCCKGDVTYTIDGVQVSQEEFRRPVLRELYAGKMSRLTLIFALYLYSCLVPLSIAALELQIRWNMLEGLDRLSTTGQIIPLTVGSISLLRAIALAIRSLFKGSREENPRVELPDSAQNQE